MGYWIFKVSDKGHYPDVPGKEYVYDNTHTVKVGRGDEFLYLQKGVGLYALTGAGRISKVSMRNAKEGEKHSSRVTRVFKAHLADVVWFSEALDLLPNTSDGKRNRHRIGLPSDLNKIGWSLSMPKIDFVLFEKLLDVAIEYGATRSDDSLQEDWRVDDSWSLVRRRCKMREFRSAVLARHDYTCIVCGTRLRSVLDAAHLRGYANDPDQRANPANGICLCRFCHGAFDAGDITLHPNGKLKIVHAINDEIAKVHFETVSPQQRKAWLEGVETKFLRERLCQ